ncbi:MAG: hypothetical protein WBX25_14535 [Rhodomicrobium sp.]
MNVGVSVSITNVYNEKVVVNNTTNVSFNGGSGGVQAHPNAQELAAAREPHTPPTGAQMKHQQLASKNPDLKRSRNGGKPPIAATRTAGDFSKKSVVAAKSAGGGPVKPASLKTHQDGNKNANPNLKHGANPNAPKGTGPGGHPLAKRPAQEDKKKKPPNG